MKNFVNKKDTKFSLSISIIFSFFMGIICFFINNTTGLSVAYDTTLETLSIFSLTFLGFTITSFTVFQIVHSKPWSEKIKTTNAFAELLNAFKLLIIISACGIFVALFFRVTILILPNKWFYIMGICIATFLISFLCSFAWRTTVAIIGLFKV